MKARPPRTKRSELAPPRRPWLWTGMLLLLVLAVYWPTLWNGFIWDDDDYVQNNVHLRSVAGLGEIWFHLGAVPQYYPLVHSTFWIEQHLWGLTPAGYHAVNLALHALAALLAWRLFTRLQVPGAWLAAALFAVHPVEVESVAWVTERKNVLSLVLALGSLLAYLRFAPPEAEPASKTDAKPSSETHRWAWYALALALYVLALWSKTITASVPAVLLVIAWWKRGRLQWREVALLLPFFAVGLAMASVTAWMEKYHVGARGADWDVLTPLARCLIAGRALWFYAGKLAFPYPLVFFYPRWQIDTGVWWQYLFPLAAVVVVVALWLARNKIGRGPLAAVLIFAGVLTPALGFFDVFPFRYSFVADHFQYHASLALFALAAATAVRLANHLKLNHQARLVIPTLLLAALATLSLIQTRVYQDLFTLYEYTLAHNPTSWAAHQNLGFQFELRGEYGPAIDHYREALTYSPDNARLYNSLGSALFAAGKAAEAVPILQTGLTKPTNLTDEADSHAHLGNALAAVGQADAAAAEYEAALKLRSNHADAYFNYGLLLANRGDLAGALAKIGRSVELNPQFDKAQYALGVLLLTQERWAEATPALERAVAMNRANPLYHEKLGIALANSSSSELAEVQLRQALAIDPRRPDTLAELARLLAARGRRGEAIQLVKRALELAPQHPLATSLAKQLSSTAGQRP